MDKEFQMARTEEDIPRVGKNARVARTNRPNRGGVLLASSRARLPVYSPTGRNKRKKAAPTAKETKGGKIKDFASASQISAEVEGANGGTAKRARRGRHRKDDKDWQSDRGIEGADKVHRRSAEELGIEWIGSFCPDNRPHYLIGRHTQSIGTIFICTNCKKSIWLPFIMSEAAKLSGLFGYIGVTKGYRKFLDRYPDARMLLAKMQNLWYARQTITDDKQFEKLVIATMEDKEYDKSKG